MRNLFIFIILICAIPIIIFAQSSENYMLGASAFTSSGAAQIQSQNYKATTTLGQSQTIGETESSSYQSNLGIEYLFLPQSSPILSLKCLLQGNLSDTLTVELRETIDGASVAEYSVTPNTEGTASLTMPTGNYYIVADHFNHLAAITAQPYSFSYGQTVEVDFTQEATAHQCSNAPLIQNNITGNWELRAGDANGDGSVNNFDFNSFTNAYGWQSGNLDYSRFVDFNADGIINLEDFRLLSKNYGQVSCVSD